MEWSGDVRQGDWIRDRLARFDSGVATAVVPGGFPAYARVLHPASRNLDGDEALVRWSEVAAWSGLALLPDSQFPDVALPERLPATPLPWDQRPGEGTLHPSYAIALADLLSRHGGHGSPWWFGVWHGFGWETSGGPVPVDVQAGPTLELPNREYFLYSGEPYDALALVEARQQTANLWWPSDHSWCVATEIDLHWTYVAGSTELIAAVESDSGLEALRVSPDAGNWLSVPSWVTTSAEEAARQLRRDGDAVIETPFGSVRATLAQDDAGGWRTTMERGRVGEPGSGTSWSSSRRPPAEESLIRDLCRSVVELLP